MTQDYTDEEKAQLIKLAQTEGLYEGYNPDKLSLDEIAKNNPDIFIAEDTNGKKRLCRSYTKTIVHEKYPYLDSSDDVTQPTNEYYSKLDFTQNKDGTLTKNPDADHYDERYQCHTGDPADRFGRSGSSKTSSANWLPWAVGGVIGLGALAYGISVAKEDAKNNAKLYRLESTTLAFNAAHDHNTAPKAQQPQRDYIAKQAMKLGLS